MMKRKVSRVVYRGPWIQDALKCAVGELRAGSSRIVAQFTFNLDHSDPAFEIAVSAEYEETVPDDPVEDRL